MEQKNGLILFLYGIYIYTNGLMAILTLSAYLIVVTYWGWLVVYLPLWKMMDFISWDDEIPNIIQYMESQSKFHGSSHHQPVILNHY